MKLTVKKCCCMNLRTAGLAIGWLGMALFSAVILNNIFNLVSLNLWLTIPETESGLVFVLTTTGTITSGLLVYGTIKNKHRMILPCLVFRAIVIALGVLFGLVGLIVICTSTQPLPAIVLVCLNPVMIALNCWIWIVLYSLYQKIRMSGLQQFNQGGIIQRF